MRSGWLSGLAVALCLLGWTSSASAWDTRVIGGLGESDWHSIYQAMPELRDGAVVLHGNEHAEISAYALNAIGAGKLLDYAEVPVVVDLNASYFRRDRLYGNRRVQPADAPRDGLERRILPPPAQFSGLPDFSYSLYDWINKNLLCPLPEGAPEREKCHHYDGWIGAALNASHFGTQAALNYRRLHAVALERARRARELRDRLSATPGALEAYRANLVEADWMALAYEGVAQHFLADRWSTGHMWERWNAGDYDSLPTHRPRVNQVTGYLAGILHGMQTVLHAKLLSNRGAARVLWPDPLSSPRVEFERKENLAKRLWKYYWRGESGEVELKEVDPAVFRHQGETAGNPGIGDYGFHDLLDGRFGGREYGFSNELPLPLPAQREEMMRCVQGGWADVIRALGRHPDGGFGALRIPLKEDSPSLDALGERCFDVYVTNRSMMLAWPFSRPTYWSQLGRAVLTVVSSDAALAALKRLGEGHPISKQAIAALERSYGEQRPVGRQAARNMVRLSHRLWRFGRAKPGGVELARGGLGPLDFGKDGRIETGDHYPAAGYLPAGSLKELPESDDPAGRDKASIYGFFSRATADYWGGRLETLLPRLRGAKTRWERSVCAYLADFAYNGTDPEYHGQQAERRTVDGKAGGLPVPSYLTALGVPMDVGRVPVHLPPGYVAEPNARTEDGLGYRSVAAWCARVPVFHLLEEPELRDRDLVGVVKGAGGEVELRGADLGVRTGQVWIGCGSEMPRRLKVIAWREDAVTARLPDDVAPGRHSVCLRRADGADTVGRFFLEVRNEPPRVALVEIIGAGEAWYRRPGNLDRPLPGGSYLLEVEFDQAMDTTEKARISLEGPGGVRLSEGRWVARNRWRQRLEVPEQGDAYAAAHGDHRLVIQARSLGGAMLDADPDDPGDQPDKDHYFRVGGNPVPASLAGCYRPLGDDSAALEVGEDGHALLLAQGGRQRFALLASSPAPDRLVLRHRFTRESFPAFYQNHDGKEVWPPDSQERFSRPCEFSVAGLSITCPLPPKLSLESTEPQPDHRTYHIDVRGSFIEWTLELRDDPSRSAVARRRLERVDLRDQLHSREGAVFEMALEQPQVDLDLMGRQLARNVSAMTTGVDQGGAAPSQALELAFASWWEERAPRLETLELRGVDGRPLQGSLPDGALFRVRGTGDSHCPGLREILPVEVKLPGSRRAARIQLRETGPDTGVYEGPESPLEASLPTSMSKAHLSVIAEGELDARVGVGRIWSNAISFGQGGALARAARSATLSVEVLRGVEPKAPPPKEVWRVYRLEVERHPGRRLPELYVVESRWLVGTERAQFIRTRYPVSSARGGGEGQPVIWGIGWRSGRVLETHEAKGEQEMRRLRKSADAARRAGFPLAELPARIASAYGGAARPLKREWGPPEKRRSTARSSGKTEAEGKEARRKQASSYRYNGPPYRARMRVRIPVVGGGTGGIPAAREEVRQVFAVPGRTRIEIDTPLFRVVNILREDLGLLWELHPQTRGYVERRLDVPETRLIPEGEETRNGRVLRRYRFKERQGGNTVEGTLWKDEHGIVVRRESRQTLQGVGVVQTRIELQNLRVGPVDPSLFELPPDYHPELGP